MQEDFFCSYFSYTKDTEVPVFFHRWAAISSIGAFLGRNYYFNHGHFPLYPNIYCMLIGSPGTRKSTAVKMIRSLLIKAGYNTIAADKTTKEKFMLDLSGEDVDGKINGDDILDTNLFGRSGNDGDDSSDVSECFIMADEFNDFFGNGNIEFISLLGTLWDFNGTYKNRIKNGKSVNIPNPTISILGGNTPTGFSLAFPSDIIGQGFFSRLLLIYGEPSGRKITFPKAPTAAETQEIISYLHSIKLKAIGSATLSHKSELLLDKIYRNWKGIDDVRFESYANRRLSHLIKLTLIVSAARCSSEIKERDVIYANTILSHTEHLMPKALGEFGKAKHSDVSHKIITLLESQDKIFPLKEIWRHVHNDLEKMNDLAELLRNLSAADKLQVVKGGFLAKRKVVDESGNDTIDYSLLTDEERNMSK